MRCLTSVSICPSLIRLLYLPHVFLCWINAWGPLWFWKNGRFICFLGALQSLFASQLSADWQTRWREQSSAKNLKFVCACQPGLTTKSWDMPCFLKHATPGLTPRTCVFFFSLQPSQPSRGESVPGVRCDLSAPEGVFFKQNWQHSGCWIGGNQALVVKLSEWNVSGFAKLQEIRSRLHDCMKPATKIWHIQNEKLSVLTQKEFLCELKRLWTVNISEQCAVNICW